MRGKKIPRLRFALQVRVGRWSSRSGLELLSRTRTPGRDALGGSCFRLCQLPQGSCNLGPGSCGALC